jgi:hypothetical protein
VVVSVLVVFGFFLFVHVFFACGLFGLFGERFYEGRISI